MARIPRVVEISCWLLGVGCLGIVAQAKWHAVEARRAAAKISPHILAADESSEPPVGTVLGRVEIPALNLTTPLVEDTSDAALLRGAGHIRGTAEPGGLGNFGVAAHRDTFFRPLSRIKAGMQIRVITGEATYLYIVDTFKIVLPQDVSVLDTRSVPQLTLVTCYPFHYIGAAPKRFVVTAHLASL